MKKLLGLIPAPWKWAAGGVALLVLLGGFSWLVRDWRDATAKISTLERELKDERELHITLEGQYKAQIDALANERRAAEARANALSELEKGVTQDAKENDRPAGPVLRNYLERLHRTHQGRPTP